MNVRLVQFIDRFIGVPLCFIFSILLFPITLFRGKRATSPQRILFIELSEMGSAVIAYSSLVKAKKLYPHAELYFLIFEKNKQSVELLDFISKENVKTIREDNFVVFTISALKALLQVRSLQIDTVIDLELFSRFTALFSVLTKASRLVGFYNYTGEGLFRGNWLTHKVLYNTHQHMELNFLSLVSALSTDEREIPLIKKDLLADRVSPPKFNAPTELTQKWQDKLFELGVPRNYSKVLILNPDPGDIIPIRGWPIESYAKTTLKLLEAHPEILILISGVEHSKPLAETIIAEVRASAPKASSRVIDICGQTADLKDYLSLLSLSNLLITNDGGPAHFATLTEIKSVVIFGPETPELYGPLGNNSICLRTSFSCSPCLTAANHRKTFCNNNLCLQSLSVERVFSASSKLMAST